MICMSSTFMSRTLSLGAFKPWKNHVWIGACIVRYAFHFMFFFHFPLQFFFVLFEPRWKWWQICCDAWCWLLTIYPCLPHPRLNLPNQNSLGLQFVFCVISLFRGPHRVGDVPWWLFVLSFLWPVVFLPVQEVVKTRDAKECVRAQKLAKLEFNTKLGMHSPLWTNRKGKERDRGNLPNELYQHIIERKFCISGCIRIRAALQPTLKK